MLFTTVYILGIISVVAAYVEDSVERRYGVRDEIESIKLNPRIKKNRDQLKNIIRYLNGRFNEPNERKTENNKWQDFVYKDPDEDNDKLVDEQEARILSALSLLQKNYNKQIRHGDEDKRVKPNLFYVENPEVLEEYTSNLRGFFSSSSEFSHESDYDRITRDEFLGHRKFDMIGPSRDKNAEKIRSHNHSRGHKSRISRGDAESRNGNYRSEHKKGRFKIESERNAPKIELKRKKPILKNFEEMRPKKISDERLEASNDKYNRNEKMKANVVLKEFNRDAPSRSKYTEKKYSDDLFDRGRKDKEIYERNRPAKGNLNKWSGRNSQSLGRTFIPYIATKTVYEDD